jgi:hypothetical protein
MTGRYERVVVEEGDTRKSVRLPRSERICLVCKQPVLEDVQHFLLHCDGYRHFRQEHVGLFQEDATVASILQWGDQRRLALLISDMLAHRAQMLLSS